MRGYTLRPVTLAGSSPIAAIIRSGALARVLGWYGCLIGPLAPLAVFPGQLRLDPHGFGLIVVGQAVWFIGAGAQLRRVRHA